jgi:RNA polymerase sigma factor (sigma-70 family)
VDDWVAELQRGRFDAAWDLFLDRYRRLIFAAIRHYARDYDDVMDVFARACEALRADEMRRLRVWVEEPEHRARFSTWLVTVVRHLTVDWFRHRDGRRRLSVVAEGLPPLRRRIFELVFLDRRSHIETYELIRSGDVSTLTFREFLSELRATYQAVATGRRGQVLRELALAPDTLENLAADPSGPNPLAVAEQGRLIEHTLTLLSPDDRMLIELYILEEIPAEAVAKVLRLPNAKAVYNRAYRALGMVRDQLERAGVRREDV